MKRYLSLALSFVILVTVTIWSGAFSAHADDADLTAIADAISDTFETYHYNPGELDSAAYREIDQATHALAEDAASVDEFVAGFTALWRDGPFSHVHLARAQATAEETAAYLDGLAIGGGGAVLTWEGDIAILTVNTMMGTDTIDEINDAYASIAETGAAALIIDLRNNAGGAFAVKPLVEHAIDTPLDAGVFVSQSWNADMNRPPNREDIDGIEPWIGWSIRDFWRDAQSNRLTVIRFEPAANHYPGPVFVLVSSQTASAAELGADALSASGRAVLIGETTQGAMLSQKMYDLPGGLQLSLPIADYYSLANGRIEGAGVAPHVRVEAGDAMSRALALASQ